MNRATDTAVAGAVAALGLFLIIAAQFIGKSPIPDPIGPKGYPTFIGVVLLAGGLVLVGRRLVRWRKEGPIVPPEGTEDDPGVPPGSALRAVTVWAITLAYILTLPILGFLLATPLFVAGLLLLLHFRRRMFGLPGYVVLPIVFTVGSYLLFATFLGIRLPLGITRPLMDLIF